MDAIIMKNHVKRISYIDTECLLTDQINLDFNNLLTAVKLREMLGRNSAYSLKVSMIYDINTLVAAVKARAVVMMNDMNSDHPLQRHLNNIVIYMSESVD